MGLKSAKSQKPSSSVEILRAHIDELTIRNLDGDWIKENKVDLDSLMEDRHPGICSRYIFRDV